MGKGGSVSDKERLSMVEDTPVNTGAVAVAQPGLGLPGGTKDADQVAPVGGGDPGSPVR